MIKQKYKVEAVHQITRKVVTGQFGHGVVVQGAEIRASLVRGPEAELMQGIYALTPDSSIQFSTFHPDYAKYVPGFVFETTWG